MVRSIVGASPGQREALLCLGRCGIFAAPINSREKRRPSCKHHPLAKVPFGGRNPELRGDIMTATVVKWPGCEPRRIGGGSTENPTIPTYPYIPTQQGLPPRECAGYPGNKKTSRHEFVWPPREFWLLRGEQTGGEPRTDEAETSTCLVRVGPETVPPLLPRGAGGRPFATSRRHRWRHCPPHTAASLAVPPQTRGGHAGVPHPLPRPAEAAEASKSAAGLGAGLLPHPRGTGGVHGPPHTAASLGVPPKKSAGSVSCAWQSH